MAYTFSLNTTGRGGSADEQAGVELALEYEAIADTAVALPPDVVAAFVSVTGLALGASHPTYSAAYCTRIDAQPNPADPYLWTVTAQFKEPLPVPGQTIDPEGSGTPTPEDRDPWVTGTFRREEVFAATDLLDRDYVNSAGDPFENPPPRYKAIGVLTVTKWYAGISYFNLKSYENKTNDEEWQGFPIDALLIVGVDFEPKTERGWLGWKVTWHLEHMELLPEQGAAACPDWPPAGSGEAAATGGWTPACVLDVGFYKKVDPGGGYVRRPAVDAVGQPVTTPILLNGVDGQESTSGAKYKGFKQYGRISFDILDP